MLDLIDVYTQSIPVFTGVNIIAYSFFCRSKPVSLGKAVFMAVGAPRCALRIRGTAIFLTGLGHYRSVSERMRPEPPGA
jgi:hypothetical protein